METLTTSRKCWVCTLSSFLVRVSRILLCMSKIRLYFRETRRFRSTFIQTVHLLYRRSTSSSHCLLVTSRWPVTLSKLSRSMRSLRSSTHLFGLKPQTTLSKKTCSTLLGKDCNYCWRCTSNNLVNRKKRKTSVITARLLKPSFSKWQSWSHEILCSRNCWQFCLPWLSNASFCWRTRICSTLK